MVLFLHNIEPGSTLLGEILCSSAVCGIKMPVCFSQLLQKKKKKIFTAAYFYWPLEILNMVMIWNQNELPLSGDILLILIIQHTLVSVITDE